MDKATLVLLAAGKGSRFGGLKQIHTFEPQKVPLAGYAIWDALKAGFYYFIAVVSPETRATFEELFSRFGLNEDRARCWVQGTEGVPEALQQQRTKPLGTGYALYSVRKAITTPFVLINGDNWYGYEAYAQALNFLNHNTQDSALVGYPLGSVLSPNGRVSRAVCTVQNGYVTHLREYTQIGQSPKGIIAYEGSQAIPLSGSSFASVNFWALQPNILPELDACWQQFLKHMTQAATEEFYLPTAIQAITAQQQRPIHLLPNTSDPCLEITYAVDTASVQAYIQLKTQQGWYPNQLE